MKRTLLSTFVITACALSVHAQKNTAYAITGAQKGQSSWTAVKLIDLTTGKEIKSIYKDEDQVEILNARTGKPVVKKDVENELVTIKRKQEFSKELDLKISKDLENDLVIIKRKLQNSKETDQKIGKEVVEKIELLRKKYEMTSDVSPAPAVDAVKAIGPVRAVDPVMHDRRHVIILRDRVQTDKPFSTLSAACAYDKKHDRLYYTPMGINQLRYIDLKSETPKIYYFEDEAFGALSSRRDIANQITRMVIGSDGNGYALTNNAEHLIRFTTKKNTVITDLGPLTDDPANGNVSVRSNGGHGGDMIADDKGNFYLITANRNVFKIGLESKVATYKGAITGLPRGYSTNGAIAEKGTTIIVSSANSTEGYFRVDINTLVAEKLANEGSVFNASDLAGGALLSAKKTNDNKEPEVSKDPIALAEMTKAEIVEGKNKIGIYPNPVSAGSTVKVTFGDVPKGKYTIQFMDISGKTMSSKVVTISAKTQMEDYLLPELLGTGNYLVKVSDEKGKVVGINKIIVQ
ncbi:MAG: T9SS type A sorting domain-containing protein [Bacteroidota bacterium]